MPLYVGRSLPRPHFWCRMIAMSTVDQITTAEQLFAANLPHCELIGGELVIMSPAGIRSWTVRVENRGRAGEPCDAAWLGRRDDRGGRLSLAHDPDTVRAPDVAFVRADRIPPGGVKGFFQGAAGPGRGSRFAERSRRRSRRQRCKTGSRPVVRWFGSSIPRTGRSPSTAAAKRDDHP